MIVILMKIMCIININNVWINDNINNNINDIINEMK